MTIPSHLLCLRVADAMSKHQFLKLKKTYTCLICVQTALSTYTWRGTQH